MKMKWPGHVLVFVFTICVIISFTLHIYKNKIMQLSSYDKPSITDIENKLLVQYSGVGRHNETHAMDKRIQDENGHESTFPEPIHIAMVVCGPRMNELTALMTSLLLFTKNTTNIHIFAEQRLHTDLNKMVAGFPEVFSKTFTFNIYDVAFPKDDGVNWKAVFRPCSSQKLFLHDVLTTVSKVIYVDSDTIFLNSLHALWGLFDDFDPSHIMAVSREHEFNNTGWYCKRSKVPYYPPTGLNTGVVLLNLDLLRAVAWTKQVQNLYTTYKDKLVLHDQDLINIYFHEHPEEVYVLPCVYNYRSCACKLAEKEGVSLLHGNGHRFHSKRQSSYVAVYDTFYQYNLTDNWKDLSIKNIISSMNENYHIKGGHDKCNSRTDPIPWFIFTHQLKKIMNDRALHDTQGHHINN